MKKKIDGVLIVEGKTDVSYLSSFIDTFFLTTNGYDLSEEKIDFLKSLGYSEADLLKITKTIPTIQSAISPI